MTVSSLLTYMDDWLFYDNLVRKYTNPMDTTGQIMYIYINILYIHLFL